MFASLRQFFVPPVFVEDDNKTRIARLLMNIVTFLMLVTLVFGLILTIPQPERYLVNFPTILLTTLFCAALIRFIHRGAIQGVALTLVLYLFLIMTYLIWPVGAGGRTVTMYFMLAVIAGVLLERRTSLYILGLILATLWAMYYAEQVGWYVPQPDPPVGVFDMFLTSTVMGIIALLVFIATKNLSEAITRAQQNEKQLRVTNQELNALRLSLEERVVERTKALQTSIEVSSQLSTILDPDHLVREVVEQIRESFAYYHTHIYLLDESKQTLVMAGGSGEVGKILLERGHSIPIGRGLVGKAARTNAPVLVPDTSANADWLPNPLLPETKAEIAVPIALGDEVVGVLDVQQNVPHGLTETDQSLLQSIANQVAIALQNARQFEQVQRSAMELRETSSFLDSVIENLPVMLFVKEAEELRFVRWNKTGEDLVGFKKEDMIGKNDFDFFAASDAEFFTSKDREVLKSGEMLDIPEEPIHTAHRGMRWLHTRKIPILGPDGTPKYLLGISEDITERKQTAELLAKRAERDRVLARLATKIRGAVSMEQILQVATQEVRQATGAARSVVTIAPGEDTIALQTVAQDS